MTSSIPAVKAALVELFTTAAPDAQVVYGSRATVTVAGPRLITVGRVFGRREPDSMSLGTAAEIYTVEVVCSASLLAATSQQTADDMALADYAACEAAVRADLTLGIVSDDVEALSVTGFGEIELAEAAGENAREAALRWTVNVYAQTT